MELMMTQIMTDQKNTSITSTIQQFGKKLFGFVRGKVKSNEDAEDILQEVWYQLTNIGNLAELENVGAWLYQVARNKVTDRFRKKTTSSIEDYTFEDEDGAFNYKDILLLDDNNNPELSYFKELFWKEMMLALDELPETQKEVFILNETEDLTLQEIADRKAENIKTIISRKSYAVKHLRKKLNYLYQEITQ